MRAAPVLTTLWTRDDDMVKGSRLIHDPTKRPGPVPHRSERKGITLALPQDVMGEPHGDHVLRWHHPN